MLPRDSQPPARDFGVAPTYRHEAGASGPRRIQIPDFAGRELVARGVEHDHLAEHRTPTDPRCASHSVPVRNVRA